MTGGARSSRRRSVGSALPTGVGLGLRWEFIEEVCDGPAIDVAFLEVSPENYMRRGGYYPAALERIRDRYRMVTHGLTLSLGSEEPRSPAFLRELRREIERIGSPFHSDHLSFSFAGERMLHELLPVRMDLASARRVADRLRATEDALGVPVAVENVTYYCHPGRREMPETEFIGEILRLSGAGLLLDVNNVYVNAQNHGFDARTFLTELPLDRVVEVHVAGHSASKWGVIVDTHGAPVIPEVAELLSLVVERTGPLPVLLERDNDVPPLGELLAEVQGLQGSYDAALERFHAREGRRAARA